MKDTIVICFSNGVFRVGAWDDQFFCIVPDRKGNKGTPDVFYVDEISGGSVGYPPDTYDVQKGRYLDAILEHIAEPNAVDGFSGLDCMTKTIAQIQQDVERFLGFPAREMIFLVPFEFSSLQHYLVKEACERNGISGRVLLRVYGAILETVYQDGCRSLPMEKFSVIGTYLEGATMEVAVAAVERSSEQLGRDFIEILDVSSVTLPFVSRSREQRIQEIESLVLKKIGKNYPDLLMMDRTHVIHRAVEMAIDEEQDGILAIPYAAIYPNWINTDQICVTRRMFQPIKNDMREHFAALTEHDNWVYAVEPQIHVLALDRRFDEDPLMKNALLSQWREDQVTEPLFVDESGLYVMHGAAAYAYRIRCATVPKAMDFLLLTVQWKDYGILSHGEFIPMMFSGKLDPRTCDIALKLKPAHENQTEFCVPLAEKCCGKVSAFGHVMVDCHEDSDIIFNLCTHTDSFLECYIGERTNVQRIVYHNSDERPDFESRQYAFEIAEVIMRNRAE